MAALTHRLAALERRHKPFVAGNSHRILIEGQPGPDGENVPYAVRDSRTGRTVDRAAGEAATDFMARAEQELAA